MIVLLRNNGIYEIVQTGSQNWEGNVVVWDDSAWDAYDPETIDLEEGQGSHGRRAPYETSGANQWAAGDIIQLKSCVDSDLVSNMF